MQRGALRSFYTDNAWIDSCLAVLSFGLSYLVFPDDMAPLLERQSTFLATLATVSGVVLAAAIFAGTMIIQTSSELLVHIKKTFHATFISVWVHILATTLLACLLSAGLLLAPPSTHVLAVGIGALVLVFLSGVRTIWWLRFLLMVEDRDQKRPGTYTFKKSSD